MEFYNDYVLKDLKEKIYYWDIIFSQEAQNLDAESILHFLKNVVLDSRETLFCKMQALKEMITWTFQDKIKQRKTISFLLDDMVNNNEELLECYRLKYLALFYQKEKEDIKDIIVGKCDENNILIKAEAKYQLGIIMFFDSNDILNKSDFLVSILKTQQIFNEVASIEENRVDAKLLSLICSYISNSINFDLQRAKNIYEQIRALIFEVILLQIDNQAVPFYLGIGFNITRIHKIISTKPDSWIDYKKEFNKLCSDFYALSNNYYKSDNLYQNFSDRINERLKKEIIEPIFKYNYKATLSKIEVIISENDIGENTVEFLEYLKEILISEDIKAINNYHEGIKENFPMLTEDDLDSFKRSLDQSNVSEAIYNLICAMQRLTPTKLLDGVVYSCIKLQANSAYKNCIEDVRNDYIRDLLLAQKYQVSDQTRQGTSQEGKSAGEIDILILENNKPYSLFEALNLDSLNRSYLDNHIDKIYKYDTLGYRYNFIVSYVRIKDFNTFWTKYINHIKEYKYPHPLDSVDENIDDRYCYPNLKIAATSLIRNGMITTLYHICVLMQE